MSTRTPEERAASRAEARRRARLSARGEPLPDEPVIEEPEAPAARGSFLGRLFPPAPPLPNRPDPLAKFDRTGPLRPIRERLYLLRKNPLAWVVPSLPCFIGFYLSETNRGDALSLVATFLTFGSIIAAGWIGWQRPSLYGTVTALIGVALVWAVAVFSFASSGVGPGEFGGPLEVAGPFVFYAAVQGALGFLGGWYGGYLRRRQTQVSAEARRTAPTRRRR